MDTKIFKGICCLLRTFFAYLRAFFAFQFLFLQSNILKTLMARFSENLTLRAEKCNSFIEDKPHSTASSNARAILHVPCHFHIEKEILWSVDLLEPLRVERHLMSFNLLLSKLPEDVR